MPKRKKRELPKVGSLFERIHGGKAYKLKVVATSGGVAYELARRVFKSPTAAAKSIVKYEINGWVFWKMDVR